MNTKKKKGFTLVELIIVLAVLLILSVLAVLAFTNLQEQFAEGARISDANTVARQINTVNSACPGDTTDAFNQISIVPETSLIIDGLVPIKATTGEPADAKIADGIGMGSFIELDLSVQIVTSRWINHDLAKYVKLNPTTTNGITTYFATVDPD